ncbi:MAG: PQQ-binding-like beta-propeller repeat protein [Acidobacteriota bacterium]|nr:PQQ-like beta-propeller repeat protein [Blastocatellia bacterium]MDW8413342.1 PQQ-binding-like beta-propeller repeat protein [Acidobacteriota bacterium]
MPKLFLLLLVLCLVCEQAVFSQGRRAERRSERRSGRARKQKKQRLAVLNPASLPLVYRTVWQYLTSDTIRLPAVANAETVYLPLASGAVVALDAKTGSLKWELLPAGRIVLPIELTSSLLLVASESGDSKGILRAVDATTGLTTWLAEFNEALSSMTAIADRIYVNTGDAKFRALELGTGRHLWSIDVASAVKAGIVAYDEFLFFGCESGLLYCLSTDGKLKWTFQARDSIRTAVAVDGERVYFGDMSGYVYAVRTNGKLLWQVRTGAAIEARPLLYDNTVYIASYDNFVYALEADSGNRKWMVNALGRLSYDLVQVADGLIVAPRSSERLYKVSLRGRLSGRFDLERGCVIAPVSRFGERLLLVTDEGLQVAEAVPIGKE